MHKLFIPIQTITLSAMPRSNTIPLASHYTYTIQTHTLHTIMKKGEKENIKLPKSDILFIFIFRKKWFTFNRF